MDALHCPLLVGVLTFNYSLTYIRSSAALCPTPLAPPQTQRLIFAAMIIQLRGLDEESFHYFPMWSRSHTFTTPHSARAILTNTSSSTFGVLHHTHYFAPDYYCPASLRASHDHRYAFPSCVSFFATYDLPETFHQCTSPATPTRLRIGTALNAPCS